MKIAIIDETAMQHFGERLGAWLQAGDIIELVGDVGAGKTTLTRSIAGAMGITDTIQSPTFTICNRYQTPAGLHLAHYDFYRLDDAGIMRDELDETLTSDDTVAIIEWGEIVADILPETRLTVAITPVATSDTSRQVEIMAHDDTTRDRLVNL